MPELTYTVPELPADSSLRQDGHLTLGERQQILGMILQSQVREAIQQIRQTDSARMLPTEEVNSLIRGALEGCLGEIPGE